MNDNQNIKKLDLLLILESAKKIGIQSLRENSIHRIMYFCYIFDYLNITKIFNYEYLFHVDTDGTYCSEIHNLLIDLRSNEDIIISENRAKVETYAIHKNIEQHYLKNNAIYYTKYKWIDTVIKILGLYGEERLFDFIYRDPNIQHMIKTNKSDVIKRDLKNLTETYLNNFKKEFEEYLKKENIEIMLDNNKYLEAYFEYIFSQIIRGE